MVHKIKSIGMTLQSRVSDGIRALQFTDIVIQQGEYAQASTEFLEKMVSLFSEYASGKIDGDEFNQAVVDLKDNIEQRSSPADSQASIEEGEVEFF